MSYSAQALSWYIFAWTGFEASIQQNSSFVSKLRGGNRAGNGILHSIFTMYYGQPVFVLSVLCCVPMIDLHLAFLIGLCYSWFHCYNNNGGFFNHWGFQFLIEETLSTSPSAAQWKKSSWSFLIKSLRIIQYHIYPRRSRQEHARNIGYSNSNLNESPMLWNIY